MSQRKALIASLVITLVLAISAIGIRAAMVDSPGTSANSPDALTLVEPGDFDDDDRYEDSDDDRYEESENGDSFQFWDEDDNDDDWSESEGDEDEEDDDDDER